jgi:hypothetical protein
MTAEEADAADHWHIPLDEWYERPRWARAGMVAKLRKDANLRRWDEILNPPKKCD